MATLANTLADDLKAAMRGGEAVRRDEIRGLLSALRAEEQARLSRDLAKRGLLRQGENADLTPEELALVDEARSRSRLSEQEEMAVLLTRAKQHRQSIDEFRKGARTDLVAAEEAQLAILSAYLPSQVDGAELEEAVRAAIRETGATDARDMGKVMGLLSQRLKGRADMKFVGARVQALLAGAG